MPDMPYPSWGIEQTGDNLDNTVLRILVGL
ncbi:MAG: hypothetical protein ACJAZ0_000893 [Halioglobus sp.]|jgi:hypothetical protein